MTVDQSPRQSNVHFYDEQPGRGDSREELLQGLLGEDRWISPRFFYDERGSKLFEQITTLPEYYPTRTEMQILTHHAGDIHAACGDGCVLIEPGSGSSEKVRLLLDALHPAAYVPIDISADFLLASARRLGEEYPWLPVFAVCADFNRAWEPPPDVPGGRRIVFYPGSTIGNLEPPAARDFLAAIRDWMGADGGALVGVDRHKDPDILHAAYNDSQGVTEAFNRNALHQVNAILGADFSPERFRHRAFYNNAARRIEMHLDAMGDQQVRLGDHTITFRDGESIHTENSYKYTPEAFEALCHAAGLSVAQQWSDSQALFSVFYLVPR